jgi:hypothetical protein
LCVFRAANDIKAKIEIKYVEGNTILTGTAENSSDILKALAIS